MKTENRFVCTCSEKSSAGKAAEIWVDTQTGVNYLFVQQGYAGGLAPLLDAEGKPVVSKEYIQND